MAQNTRPRSASLIQGLLQQRQWPSSQLFGWLLDDVLADLTGQRKPDPPPVEALSSLRDLAGEYARCVAEHPPFEDLLGPVFMEVAHRGDQQARGQFFTPPGIARLTAEMLNVEYSGPHPDGRLWQVYEPASGAGGSYSPSSRCRSNDSPLNPCGTGATPPSISILAARK